MKGNKQNPPKTEFEFKGNPVNVRKSPVPSQDVRSRKPVTKND